VSELIEIQSNKYIKRIVDQNLIHFKIVVYAL